MTKPTILVTAAAGKTGSATAKQLLALGYPVKALVRTKDDRSTSLGRLGAEVVVASLEDLEQTRSAMRGVQRAYFCPPLEPGTLRRAALFAAAAEEAGLEVVVALSQWLSDPLHSAIHAREKWLAKRVLDAMKGVAAIEINAGWFADNYMAAIEPIVQFGLFALPLGEGQNAPPSTDDIAKVIVGCLINPDRHAGKSYRPTGPTLLSPSEIAAVFGKVLGRKVKYQNAPMRLFLKIAKSQGLADFVISQLYFFLLDYQRNSFGIGAPTDAVREVGGANPESFETIVESYFSRGLSSHRSLRTLVNATGSMVRGLLTAAPDVPAILDRLGLPHIFNESLAADSQSWLQLHRA